MCRSDADMLTGSNAGHAANAIFPDDKTLLPQKRGLKAIFTRFLTAANNAQTPAVEALSEPSCMWFANVWPYKYQILINHGQWALSRSPTTPPSR